MWDGKLVSDGSLVLWGVKVCYRALRVFSPIHWLERRYEKKDRRLPFWVAELWCMALLVASAATLVLARHDCLAAELIACYSLIDAFAITLRETLIGLMLPPDKGGVDEQGAFVTVRSRPRYLALAILNISQIVLCFAILYRVFGARFCPVIDDWTTALYQSTLTFTTLGYGEITPHHEIGRWLVMAELWFFIVVLTVRVPVAVSMIRVKEDREWRRPH